MVRLMSSPASPRRRPRRSPGPPGRSRRARTRSSRGDPPRIVLVVLLDAVLALALAIDEPEQVRGQGRVRAAAGLGIDPQRLGLEGDALDGAVARRGADPVRHRRLDAAGQDDVRLVLRSIRSRSVAAAVLVQPEHPDRAVGRLAPLLAGQAVAATRPAVAGHRRGEDDGAGPVVDLAARSVGSSTRTDVCDAAWSMRKSRCPTCQNASRATSASAPTTTMSRRPMRRRRESVRPSMSVDRARREDDGVVQLAEAVVDGLLADGRLAPEAVQVRLAGPGLGVRALLLRARADRCRSWWPRRARPGRARRTRAGRRRRCR